MNHFLYLLYDTFTHLIDNHLIQNMTFVFARVRDNQASDIAAIMRGNNHSFYKILEKKRERECM